MRERIADINSNVENSIQGIREVQAFTNEDYEIEKFYGVNREFRSAKEGMYCTMAAFHAHRLSTVQWVDHTYVVMNGSVVEEGSHDELLGRRGHYHTLYQSSLF